MSDERKQAIAKLADMEVERENDIEASWMSDATPEEIAEIMGGNATVIMSPQYRQLKQLNLLLQVFHRPDIRAAVNNQSDCMEIWDLLTECWSGVLVDLKEQGVG